jgi:hypothetical protein
MRTSPRNIRRLSFVALLALALSSQLPLASAQQRGRSRPKPATKTQTQETERARRAKALTLLVETADGARTLDDLFYRARLQALAADALYPFDQQRARATFRRAWEAATASDKAEQEAMAQEAAEPLTSIEPVTEARDKVLSLAAARDLSLAKIFLSELPYEKSDESDATAGEPALSMVWRELSARGARRLALAYELLDQGDAESAARLAIPAAAEGASPALMIFLLRLSQQNAAAGDTLYRSLIFNSLHKAEADANTVLLLSTPIVSPGLMVAVDEYGSLQFRPVALADSQAGPLQPVPFATRTQFLYPAANVLLRPVIQRPGVSETQDKAARYFAIGRLLPLYEREAAQFVPELQARATALLNEFTESRRASLSSQLNLRSIGNPPSTDPLRSHFEERARTSDQAERDRITISIILVAARNRSWVRARLAAAELSDEGTRRAAYAFIAVNQIADISKAYADEKEDDYAEIVAFLKGLDVPPLAAAWGYAQAAEVAARKRDPQRVAELLTEAEHYAERVAPDTAQRVAAYGVILKSAARLDRQRAWELLTQLVKAANALEDYAGDEVSIEIRTDETAAVATETPFTLTAEVFRLDSVFATMAHLDFERALTTARALTGDVPRLFAQLAIARAALEKKS